MDNWEAETLNISGIVDDSIVDGPGLRYTIFVQGCPHGCPECHNPQTHSFEENKRVTLGQLMSEIKENPLLYGVTFSGGEPFCQPGPLAILGQQIKKAGMHLMCYSGYTYEQLLKRAETEPDVAALLDVVDVLVDGPFLIGERDLELLYRGSRNQRLIDLKAMREKGDRSHVILWQEFSASFSYASARDCFFSQSALDGTVIPRKS